MKTGRLLFSLVIGTGIAAAWMGMLSAQAAALEGLTGRAIAAP